MDKMDTIELLLIAILIFAISTIIGTLIFWGLGNLIILVFKINYEWTIIHGFVIDLIYIVLKEIFKK